MITNHRVTSQAFVTTITRLHPYRFAPWLVSAGRLASTVTMVRIHSNAASTFNWGCKGMRCSRAAFVAVRAYASGDGPLVGCFDQAEALSKQPRRYELHHALQKR